MFRAAMPAIVAVLVLTSVVRAEIVNPLFVRGNRLNPPVSYASGVKYDTLTAFNSAADMAAFANGFGSYRMGGNRQWGWDRWKFFDGTNYYRVQWQDASPWKLYNYGSSIYRLLNDSTNLLDPQDFAATPRGVDVDPADSMINFFADTDGAIYQVWQSEWDLEFTNKVTKFDSIADLLAGTGTDFDSVEYRWGDNFIGLNGKFYRTNSEPEPEEQGGRIAESSVFGIAEYDSFADLLAGTSSAVYGGGDGLAWDLFMAVPKAHLTHLSSSVGGTPPVPEIDPAGMGSVLALVGGVLGLLERRRTRA